MLFLVLFLMLELLVNPMLTLFFFLSFLFLYFIFILFFFFFCESYKSQQVNQAYNSSPLSVATTGYVQHLNERHEGWVAALHKGVAATKKEVEAAAVEFK